MENSFDVRASTWDENPRRIKMVENVSAIIVREIPIGKNDRIIDYGFGTGLLGYKLIDHVEAVTFCDTSEGMLEQVRQKQAFSGYRNVTILNADLLHQTIARRFDLIFSMLVLHHVEKLGDLIVRFANQLNSGGVFCWIDLDKEDGSFHGDNTIPHLGFAKDDAEGILKKAGFEPFFYTNELFIEKEVEGVIKQFPIFILAARKG